MDDFFFFLSTTTAYSFMSTLLLRSSGLLLENSTIFFGSFGETNITIRYSLRDAPQGIQSLGVQLCVESVRRLPCPGPRVSLLSHTCTPISERQPPYLLHIGTGPEWADQQDCRQGLSSLAYSIGIETHNGLKGKNLLMFYRGNQSLDPFFAAANAKDFSVYRLDNMGDLTDNTLEVAWSPGEGDGIFSPSHLEHAATLCVSGCQANENKYPPEDANTYCYAYTEVVTLPATLRTHSQEYTYVPGANCTWLVGPHAVDIEVSVLDGISGFASLYIYAGKDRTGPLLLENGATHSDLGNGQYNLSNPDPEGYYFVEWREYGGVDPGGRAGFELCVRGKWAFCHDINGDFEGGAGGEGFDCSKSFQRRLEGNIRCAGGPGSCDAATCCGHEAYCDDYMADPSWNDEESILSRPNLPFPCGATGQMIVPEPHILCGEEGKEGTCNASLCCTEAQCTRKSSLLTDTAKFSPDCPQQGQLGAQCPLECKRGYQDGGMTPGVCQIDDETQQADYLGGSIQCFEIDLFAEECETGKCDCALCYCESIPEASSPPNSSFVYVPTQLAAVEQVVLPHTLNSFECFEEYEPWLEAVMGPMTSMSLLKAEGEAVVTSTSLPSSDAVIVALELDPISSAFFVKSSSPHEDNTNDYLSYGVASCTSSGLVRLDGIGCSLWDSVNLYWVNYGYDCRVTPHDPEELRLAANHTYNETDIAERKHFVTCSCTSWEDTMLFTPLLIAQITGYTCMTTEWMYGILGFYSAVIFICSQWFYQMRVVVSQLAIYHKNTKHSSGLSFHFLILILVGLLRIVTCLRFLGILSTNVFIYAVIPIMVYGFIYFLFSQLSLLFASMIKVTIDEKTQITMTSTSQLLRGFTIFFILLTGVSLMTLSLNGW